MENGQIEHMEQKKKKSTILTFPVRERSLPALRVVDVLVGRHALGRLVCFLS